MVATNSQATKKDTKLLVPSPLGVHEQHRILIQNMIEFIKNTVINYRKKHTPLWKAILENNIDLVQLLLMNDADSNQIIDTIPKGSSFRQHNGHTPLTLAMSHYVGTYGYSGNNVDLEIVVTLLNSGANVNLAVKTGRFAFDTPLSFLIRGEGFDEIRLDLVKLLIAHGADVFNNGGSDGGYNHIKADNLLGFSILHLDMLRQKKGKEHFDIKDNLISSRINLIKLLIEKGLDSKFLSPFIRKLVLQECHIGNDNTFECFISLYLTKIRNNDHYGSNIEYQLRNKEEPEYIGKIIRNGLSNMNYIGERIKPRIAFTRNFAMIHGNPEPPEQLRIRCEHSEKKYIQMVFRSRAELIMKLLTDKPIIPEHVKEISISAISLEIYDTFATSQRIAQDIAKELCLDIEKECLIKYGINKKSMSERFEEILFCNIIKHLSDLKFIKTKYLRGEFKSEFFEVLGLKPLNLFDAHRRDFIYDYVRYGLPLTLDIKKITPDKIRDVFIDILTAPDRYNNNVLQSYVKPFTPVYKNLITETSIIEDYLTVGNKDFIKHEHTKTSHLKHYGSL